MISEANGNMPVLGSAISGAAITAIKRQRSVPQELEAAMAAILSRLSAAHNPVAVVTHLVSLLGVRDLALDVIRQANLPTAGTPNEKGTIDESMPQYIGLYAGDWTSSDEVRALVGQADLVLDIGGIVTTELNTGLWTGNYDPARIVSIQDNWARSGEKVFLNVAIDDVLTALSQKVSPRAAGHDLKLEPAPHVGAAEDPLSSAAFYPRLQRCLKHGDTVVIETGTCMTHLNRMLLPAGVTAEGQGLWGSIGWATPACLGVAMAKTDGRTWMVTGDGSHQLTLNELAVMGRYGIKPVIFVLNNGLFGIEDVISERGHAYDDLAPVQYYRLPQAFGCKNWLTAKVSWVAELDRILDQIPGHDGARPTSR
ncbi:thiamine pyrophosphate-dependent enzyme [Synechococcus sp. CBW1006]|uniref:thiamine pyrophosphate-dependent enzyme n=1 Tax=Synechococcus sp. CBW1006 TaxID=1353138 RepID=UPI001E5E9A95|nr:thiamine pyrophosphate-dependent enzyme [Synechococcus sp. CBW1006]